jgi:hypothetical protein
MHRWLLLTSLLPAGHWQLTQSQEVPLLLLLLLLPIVTDTLGCKVQ